MSPPAEPGVYPLLLYATPLDIQVIEFMAVESYKRLISWEMVRHATHANVLHTFSRQYAGSALLPSLGALANKMLISWTEDELLNLKPGHSTPVPEYNDEIVFQQVSIPESTDLARETDKAEIRLTFADGIGRMRRNIIKFLGSLSTAKDYEDSFSTWVKILMDRGLLERYVGKLMLDFARSRNNIEYRGHQITSEEWENVQRNYRTIEEWATKGRSLQISLEKV